MLFNSLGFIFVFMPATLLLFFTVARIFGRVAAACLLVAASLFFYAWDEPWRLLPLILGSTAFNFLIGAMLKRHRSSAILAFGIAGDLALLGFFKYSGLLAGSFNALSPVPIPEPHIVLPIGISFYTFTQVAFLVDSYRGEVKHRSPVHYGLFVTFFPHLIAGPILHHQQIIPQFERPDTYRFNRFELAYGLTYFVAGLFKKVVLADNIAVYANSFFKAVSVGAAPSGADAWIGALSYTFQLYFDFSGYSDMAIGLALMFGVRFPLNFNSPYKAISLIDFWRRWHITLSTFLRDYLYFSLGGNRRGPVRRYLNLMVTMVLGGLWHGALWNFGVWGGIHGLGLIINHQWRRTIGRRFALPVTVAWALTFLLVVLAWVPFRAETLGQAVVVWAAMLNVTNWGNPASASVSPALPLIAVLAGIVLMLPNTQAILGYEEGGDTTRFLKWKPSLAWGLVTGSALGLAIAGVIERPTSFLYFRF